MSIRFTVKTDGSVQVVGVKGHGKKCKEVTKAYEKALGNSQESTREYTEEYGVKAEESLTVDV